MKNLKIYAALMTMLLIGSNLELRAQTIVDIKAQGIKKITVGSTTTWSLEWVQNASTGVVEREVEVFYQDVTSGGVKLYADAPTSGSWEFLMGSGSSWQTAACRSIAGTLTRNTNGNTLSEKVTIRNVSTVYGTYDNTITFSIGSNCNSNPGSLTFTVEVKNVNSNIYNWIEPQNSLTDSSFTRAANWSPTRTSPSSSDVLIVDLAQGQPRTTTIWMDNVNESIDQFLITPNNIVTFKCTTNTNTPILKIGKGTSTSGDDFSLDSLGAIRSVDGNISFEIQSNNTAMLKGDLTTVSGILNINGPGGITQKGDIKLVGGSLNYKSSSLTNLNFSGTNSKISGTSGTLYIDSTVNVNIGIGTGITTSNYTLERVLPIISNLTLRANTTLISNAPTSYTDVSAINSWTPFLQLKATPKANSTAHGQLLNVPASASITGGAQFEIYNNKQRAYRAFGIPLSGGTMIPQFTDDIDVTGNVSGSNANDFTTTCSWCTHSIFQWNESTSAWSPYSSGNSVTNIPLGTGILTFFRGARGNGLGDTTIVANEEVLDFKGQLTKGSVSITLNNGGTGTLKGYNLVGNPYPCAVDLRQVYESNKNAIMPRFYLYDAIARRYNEWDSVSSNGNSVTPKKNGTSKFSNPGSNNRDGRILDAGGAVFFVVNNNASTVSLDFTEAHKVSGLRSATKHFSSGVQEEVTYPCNEIKGELRYQDATWTESDGFTMEFDMDGVNSDGDKYDMNKLYAGYMGLGTLTANNAWLSIDRRDKIAAIGETKSVPLKVAYPKEGPSAMELSFNFCSEGNPNYKIQLFDKKDNSATDISNGSVYSFTASNTEEKKADRFELLFTGIEKQNSTRSLAAAVFSVFPNPSEDGIFHILNNSQAVTTECQVYNLNGQLIQAIDLKGNANIETIDLTSLAKGMYILNIISNQKTQTQKVQIQ